MTPAPAALRPTRRRRHPALVRWERPLAPGHLRQGNRLPGCGHRLLPDRRLPGQGRLQARSLTLTQREQTVLHRRRARCRWSLARSRISVLGVDPRPGRCRRLGAGRSRHRAHQAVPAPAVRRHRSGRTPGRLVASVTLEPPAPMGWTGGPPFPRRLSHPGEKSRSRFHRCGQLRCLHRVRRALGVRPRSKQRRWR